MLDAYINATSGIFFEYHRRTLDIASIGATIITHIALRTASYYWMLGALTIIPVADCLVTIVLYPSATTSIT
jgi:hypothetical protein